MTADVVPPRGVPGAAAERLPGYLRALTTLRERGTRSVSSEELAALTGVTPALLRRDLSHLGPCGVRGVGYEVDRLVAEITATLGLTREWRVVIVGTGNLGRALAAYPGFGDRGFSVTALLDIDPDVVGTEVAGHIVRPLADLAEVVAEGLDIGVVATPASAAQGVADVLVAAGVRSILNLAPASLAVPEPVVVRQVDLATELQILAFHERRKSSAVPCPPLPAVLEVS